MHDAATFVAYTDLPQDGWLWEVSQPPPAPFNPDEWAWGIMSEPMPRRATRWRWPNRDRLSGGMNAFDERWWPGIEALTRR